MKALLNKLRVAKYLIQQVCNSYNAKQPGWGRASVIDFEDLLNPEQVALLHLLSILNNCTVNMFRYNSKIDREYS